MVTIFTKYIFQGSSGPCCIIVTIDWVYAYLKYQTTNIIYIYVTWTASTSGLLFYLIDNG